MLGYIGYNLAEQAQEVYGMRLNGLMRVLTAAGYEPEFMSDARYETDCVVLRHVSDDFEDLYITHRGQIVESFGQH